MISGQRHSGPMDLQRDPLRSSMPWHGLVTVLLVALLALALFWPPPAWGAADRSDAEARGAQLFEAHCVGCHINGGNIIRRGRTLRQPALERRGLADPEAIARVAAEGIGSMGGYAAVLGEGGAEAVGQWVWRQALEGWPKG